MISAAHPGQVNRVDVRPWRALKYWDRRLTEEHRDYLRCGWRGSLIDVQCELKNGNFPDGLYITDGALVYRVTGGRLETTIWRLA